LTLLRLPHNLSVVAKSQQLQVRVSPAQKAALKRHARLAGLDVSTYVLSRALPVAGAQVADVLHRLAGDDGHRFALAELNDLLAALPPAAFMEAVEHVNLRGLSPFRQNYVSAMVEHAAHLKSAPAPTWVHEIDPLESPYFAVPFPRLRVHLLRSAPVAFKRRNLFVDATVGDRV